MTAVKSPWIIAFGIVAVLHLVFHGMGLSPLDTITKCLLAPLLALWAIQLEAPRLLVLGLVFCFFGDLFMDLNARDVAWGFAAGMGAFALAHVCFITLFVQRGALAALRRKLSNVPTAVVSLLVVAAAVALIAWAWPGIDPSVRFAVPIYAVLLGSTAATALALDTRAGVGALLFVASDILIALGEAGRFDATAVWHKLAVMALYILAIFLITAGVLNRERRTRRIAADGFDITQRTDCWPVLP